MAYLKFDKSQLVNLEYSLTKEFIRSNRAGSYSSTTIIYCNTRKYHGLLIVPVDALDGDRHVLLSSCDETIIEREEEFNLGIHKYQGDIYSPRGHKYIRDFMADPTPTIVYRVGNVVLMKEGLLVEKEEQVLFRYTILESDLPVRLRFRPFLAFRNMHTLSRANLYANTRGTLIPNGAKFKLYDGYPFLHLQFSKEAEFVPAPDWYYGIEYNKEMRRGYDYKEDLFVPGYFELNAKKGDAIIFSAGTSKANPEHLKRKYTLEMGKRIPRNSFKNCLINSAQQFFIKHNKKTEVIAGFPWFGCWGRDTFIALPGLTLAIDDVATCKDVLDTQITKLKNGLFPNTGNEDNPAFNSVDAPLWFFWAIQQYTKVVKTYSAIWHSYGRAMKSILEAYRQGTSFNIKMQENGLIYAGATGKALTWMDAVVNGKPVTPRTGFPVEISALWYNAVMFSLELAKRAKDEEFLNTWEDLPSLIKESFLEMFWNPHRGFLADVVDYGSTDWSVRPNQVIAVSLEYSMLSTEIKKAVLNVVERDLLTPRGLRTLSPTNPAYQGMYKGTQEQRDSAYHQGTVWPWLLEHYCEGYMNLYKESGLGFLKQLIDGFEPVLTELGLGTIPEIFDGDPPHRARGAISQAWSVAALLQIIRRYELMTRSQ
jgi:predicted glycogen debranching enzyme